jgi:hypothetical protein
VSPIAGAEGLREGCFAANRGSVLLGANLSRVRGRLQFIAARALAIMAAAWLCACGGGSSISGSSLLNTSIFSGSSTLVLAPIVGPPPNVASEMTSALVAAGKERKLNIVTSGSGDFNMRGYLAASSEKKGARLSYIWDITDSKGARVARFSGEEAIASRPNADPWSGVDSGAIRSIAGKSTSQIAAGMPRRGVLSTGVSSASPESPPSGASTTTAAAPASAAAPAPKGPVMAQVPYVTGAPGDGRSSLTAAIKKKLYAGGVKLAGGSESAGRNVYTVKGVVSVKDAGGGKETIKIDWQVIDPNGRSLGNVTQQNTIPKGSLSGPWGAIADAAAGAAASGIIKLLPKT